MEISDLKIFLAVAQNGSISRAAEELNYVQSNVTARIKQLEERSRTCLFHRRSKGVVLTVSGHLLVDYAKRIIQLTKEAENAITNQDQPRGRLLIGSMETTAAVRLPPLLAAYHRSYPAVELNLVTGPSAESLKRLLDYQIEGALVAGAVPQETLIAEKAYEEELILVAPASINEINQIKNLKVLVFRTGCTYRAKLEEWLKATGKVPSQIMELGSIEGILGCVAAGMGISFLPRSVVEQPHVLKTCSIHTLADDFRHMTTWFVRRRNEEPSKALQVFRDLMVSNQLKQFKTI